MAANLQPNSQKLTWRRGAALNGSRIFTGRSEGRKARIFLLRRAFGAQRGRPVRARQPPLLSPFRPSDLPVKIRDSLGGSRFSQEDRKDGRREFLGSPRLRRPTRPTASRAAAPTLLSTFRPSDLPVKIRDSRRAAAKAQTRRGLLSRFNTRGVGTLTRRACGGVRRLTLLSRSDANVTPVGGQRSARELLTGGRDRPLL
jgi:hypothetical protein